MSKGSGRRKENKALIDKNWDNIKWGVKDADGETLSTESLNRVSDALKGDGDTYEEAATINDEMRLHSEKMEMQNESIQHRH